MSVIYYELPDYGDDVLMHHGIKGMKWGIRRTAEQLGHFTKKVYKTGKDLRDRRIERAKNDAIASGSYKKIAKQQKHMTDAELQKANQRMNAMNQLRDTAAKKPERSKRLDKEIDKAIRDADYQKVAKLQKHMSDEEYKQAFNRLDTTKKLKDAYKTSTVEKGIRVIETIGRVGKGVLTIKETAAGFNRLKDEKAELKAEKQKRKETKAATKDPFMKKFKEDAEERAKKASDEAYAKAKGSDADKAFAAATAYNSSLNTSIETYNQQKRRSGRGWSVTADDDKKKKK